MKCVNVKKERKKIMNFLIVVVELREKNENRRNYFLS